MKDAFETQQGLIELLMKEILKVENAKPGIEEWYKKLSVENKEKVLRENPLMLAMEILGQHSWGEMVDKAHEFSEQAKILSNSYLLNLRLKEIADLKTGWYDGDGEKISSLAIEKAREFLKENLGQNYRLYPTVSGGISIEWETDRESISLEIDEKGDEETYSVPMESTIYPKI